MRRIVLFDRRAAKVRALFLAAAATLAAASFAGVVPSGGGVRVETPSLVATLPSGRNYCPVMEGVGEGGKFGILLQTKVWYHGRTGNARRFYEDQDEFSWSTRSCETSDSGVVVTTGTVDYDVRREVSIEPADREAIRLDYLLTAAETRFFDPVDFPLLYFSKEAESVSFDDGRLGSFETAANPSRSQTLRSRACLLHFPKRGKTLIMLVDVNRPLALGHALGTSLRQSVNGWSRVFNFTHLFYEEFPFFEKGTRLGARMWFKLVDGGEFSEAQAEAARALASAVGARDAAFLPEALDGVYAEPSRLAASLPSPKGVSLWTETPMKRVYPGTRQPYARADAVKLEMAANERETFQLVVRPQSPVRLESVEFSDFTSDSGARIAASNASAWLLGYETVADPNALFRGETRFADRMIPLGGGAALPAGENSVLHCTVFAPPGTRPGVYRAEAAVSVGGERARVPVEVRVWNVELPRETAFIGHMLIWSSPCARREQVLRRFSECGMMGSVYNGGGAPKLRECFDGKTLRVPDGFALAEKSVKEFGAPYFQVPWGFMGAWNWNTNKTVFLGLDLKLDSREFDEAFSGYLSSLGEQLGRRGILDRSFIYMWDEMTEGHYPAMRKTTDMVRRFAPGLKVLTVSGPDPEVLANNDIVVAAHPAHWWSEEARAVVKKANRDGKRIWMYANSVTFGTASRAIIPRLTAWLCRSHGMSGYLHWSCDFNWKANDFAKNGKEWILYPSDGEPVYSVRMEYFRDGVEDFNLMALSRGLPKADRVRLERSIAEISSDRSALLADPVRVAAVRRLVAEALSAK